MMVFTDGINVMLKPIATPNMEEFEKMAKAIRQGRLSVVGSPEILWEYERVLLEVAKRKVTKDFEIGLPFRKTELNCYNLGVRSNYAVIPWMICSSVARSPHAVCIVSGDQDLLILKSVEGIPILNAAVFHSKYPGLFSS